MHIRVYALDQARVNFCALTGETTASQLIEEFGREARPQIGIAKMPGVEADLNNPTDETRRCRFRDRYRAPLPFLLPAALRLRGGDRVDCGFEAQHERRLARSPAAKQPDRQRRSCLFQANQASKGLHIRLDPERIAGGIQRLRRPVGSEPGDAQRAWRWQPAEEDVPPCTHVLVGFGVARDTTEQFAP